MELTGIKARANLVFHGPIGATPSGAHELGT